MRRTAAIVKIAFSTAPCLKVFQLVIGDGDRPGQAHPHTLLRKFQIGHCLPDGLGCLPARLQSAEIEDRHNGHEVAGLGFEPAASSCALELK